MSTNQLYPLNWCDFIDVPHILVGVHSLVYDALGSFDSLKVSSVSCLKYLVFSVDHELCSDRKSRVRDTALQSS